jgi:preprotein translocase subunit YajC
VFAGSQDLFLWAILVISIGMFFFMIYNFRKNIKECAECPEEPVDELEIF